MFYDDLKVLCLESNQDLCGGASGGNSGIICTGYDAPHGSLERRCLSDAKRIALDTLRLLGVPFQRTGALVVAWTDEELAKLPALLQENLDVGDSDAKLISAEELYLREPWLRPSARGALLIPGETVVDSWLLPIAFAEHASQHGAEILCGKRVTKASKIEGGGKWELLCADGTKVLARKVVNAGGNFADDIERLHSGEEPRFRCKPRRGQYAVFQPAQGGPTLSAPIQPVPTDRTKGVYVFQSLYGHIVCGPTAEDIEERSAARTDPETVERLVQHALEFVPGLRKEHFIGSYAGLRPATEHRDYQIHAQHGGDWVTAAGIRSTGLSASLGIAPLVSSLLALTRPRRPAPKPCTPLPSLQQLAARLQTAGEGAAVGFGGGRSSSSSWMGPGPVPVKPAEGGGESEGAAVTLTLGSNVPRRVTHPLARWGLMALRARARL